MSNPVTFFEVVGRDAEALQSFYRDAFDWQMQPFAPIPSYATVSPGAEDGIGGGVGPAYDSGLGHATFYIEVANLEEALSKVESLGGRKVMGPADIPDGPSIAVFTDPEGHVVGLFRS
ncbi:MAG: VOC family protein [Actinomycetota bacterium]|nr:VOC family protein [Actinomycetota bacterium]